MEWAAERAEFLTQSMQTKTKKPNAAPAALPKLSNVLSDETKVRETMTRLEVLTKSCHCLMESATKDQKAAPGNMRELAAQFVKASDEIEVIVGA